MAEDGHPRLRSLTRALRLCLLSSLATAALFGVLAGAIDAASYKPDPSCILFCSRTSDAVFTAAIGAFGGAITGLALGALWLLWRPFSAAIKARRTRK